MDTPVVETIMFWKFPKKENAIPLFQFALLMDSVLAKIRVLPYLYSFLNNYHIQKGSKLI